MPTRYEILKQRPDIKAVLTDADMAGSLDGFEFARLVRQGWRKSGCWCRLDTLSASLPF